MSPRDAAHRGHAHGAAARRAGHRRRLWLVLGLTAAVFVAELVGGLLSGSLALLADAAHVLTDSTALLIALIAAGLAGRPATPARTFGLLRVEVLAALLNGLLLLGIAVGTLVAAVGRWADPPAVSTPLMLAVAVGGALVNGAGLLVLHGAHRESLNLRAAYLEVLGDLLGSGLVVVAAVVIATTGWTRADVLASIAIVALIVPRAVTLLRDVVDVLLEATPRGVDLDQVRRHIEEVPGVVGVHDLHAWTITSGVPALSAHVVVDEACLREARSGEVLERLRTCLGDHFDVEHCTFQIEPLGHQEHEHAQHL